jgi:murein DD-endopeptidase MepM/ murein hydrolase activator NlpD
MYSSWGSNRIFMAGTLASYPSSIPMRTLCTRLSLFSLGLISFAATAVTLAPAVGHEREGGPTLAEAALPDRAQLVVQRPSRREGPLNLTWPGDGLRTGWFGEGRASHSHPGVDLDGETGDPVWAAGPGTVVWAGPAPTGYGGYGTLVDIDHGSGIHTLYAHLSSLAAQAGQIVEPGTLVGAIGTTGSVTGSHLHFEVRVNGVAVNPEDWLPPRPAVPPSTEDGPGVPWRSRM